MKTTRSELTYLDPISNKNVSSSESIFTFVAEADPSVYFIGFYDDNNQAFQIMPYRMLKDAMTMRAWCEQLNGPTDSLSAIENSLNEQFSKEYGKMKLIEVFKDYRVFNWEP